MKSFEKSDKMIQFSLLDFVQPKINIKKLIIFKVIVISILINFVFVCCLK